MSSPISITASTESILSSFLTDHPLAIAVLILSWSFLLVLRKTEGRLRGATPLPRSSELTRLEKCVLLFPATLTLERLRTMRALSNVSCMVTTVFSVSTLIAEIAFTSLSEPPAPSKREPVDPQPSMPNSHLLDELDAGGSVLRAGLEAERSIDHLEDGPDVVPGTATPRDSEIMNVSNRLDHLIERIEDESERQEISEVDKFRVRLAKAAMANSEGNYALALELTMTSEAIAGVVDDRTGIAWDLKADEVRGDAFYGLRNWQKASECYQRVLGSHPELWSIRLASAHCLDRQGHSSQAIGDYKQIIEHYRKLVYEDGECYFSDELAIALTYRGSVLRRLHQPEEAMRDFEEAIEILTNLVRLQGRTTHAGSLVNSHAQQGRAQNDAAHSHEALLHFNRAADIHNWFLRGRATADESNTLASVLTERSKVQLRLEKISEAIVDLRGAISIRRKLVKEDGHIEYEEDLACSLNNLAWVLLKHSAAGQEEKAKALQMAVEAVTRTNRSNPMLLDTLALAYFMTDDPHTAEKEQLEALTVLDRDSSLREDYAALRKAFEARLAQYRSSSRSRGGPDS